MLDGNQILNFTINSIVPFLIGAVGVGLYYRSKLINTLNELADKRAIVTAVIHHSEEQERANVKVKKVSKQVNTKTAVVEPKKLNKRKTTKK